MKYEIPEGTPQSACRSCQATIYWVKTPAGKNMPVNPDGEPHWGTCPQAKQWTKRKQAT